MRMSAYALAIGATLGSLNLVGALPFFMGAIALAVGGVFVGMLAIGLLLRQQYLVRQRVSENKHRAV